MKYIGNIGHLLNSIYVKDKLPKSRRRRIYGKKPPSKYHNKQTTDPTNVNNEKSVGSKLYEIRNQVENENRIKGSQSEIREGFVYIVTNPVFSGWVKAGMTMDFEKRLSNYNTGDPFTNYNMIVVKWVKDRKEAEKTVHHVLKFKSEEHKGEWFKLNEHLAKEIVESLVL